MRADDNRWRRVLGVALGAAIVLVAVNAARAGVQEETQALLDRLLAPPALQAEAGFRAELLIPPGRLYDPLWMHLRQNGEVWMNDDGGEEGDKGSQIMTVQPDGTLGILVGLGRLLPATGFDVAPQGFGGFAGQILTISQARVAAPGATANHVIQRVDPASSADAALVCTLPEAGRVNQGVAGFGVDARFGPAGSRFADRFFAITAYNNAIYQVDAKGRCTPFVTFDGAVVGAPFGLGFTRDGAQMLVTLKLGGVIDPPRPGAGQIVRVGPDGTVDAQPFAVGFTHATGLAFAPAGFGRYGGQLFVADLGAIEAPVPATQALQRDGKIYRVDAQGETHLVASGFINPVGLRFVGDALWVTDINGDFIAGGRELPEGFVAALRIAD